MTRALFLAYHFPPIGGAGVQREVKFVRYLPEFDCEPIVVTGMGPVSARWTPEDDTMLSEIPESVRVLRIPEPEPAPSEGWRRRGERWLGAEMPWSRWWSAGTSRVARSVASEIDVVYASLVPYELGESAVRLARALGKPLVVDLQDPWALDEMMIYPTAVHRRRGVARMRSVLAASDGIVMNTPRSARLVLERFPELARTPVVSIPNGFDPADFAGPPPERTDSAFRIVHTGYLHTDLGLAQRRAARARRILGGAVPGIDILTRSHIYLLEAVERLRASNPRLGSSIEIHLAGVLSPTDVEIAKRSPSVRMLGYLSHADTVGLMRSADLLFLPMQNLPLGTPASIVPGKTYEYLASGRPILAAVPEGDARDLLSASGTAVICRPDDVAGMARAIVDQIERARSLEAAPERRDDVLARFQRRHLAGELAALFEEVLRRRGEGVGRQSRSGQLAQHGAGLE